MSRKIVLASKNKGKLREFKEMITREALECEVLSLDNFPGLPPVKEDGATFKENAYKKASTVAQYTGLLTLADDSGLEVDYLDGAPGIYSARFAGEPKNDEKNNKKLLKLLKDVPVEKRSARFRCVISIVTPQGDSYFTEGVCEGLIAKKPSGNNGFGFDPLFYLPDYGKTMAELSSATKNEISHRAQAFKKALEILKKVL